MPGLKAITISFPSGNLARAVTIPQGANIGPVITTLKLPQARGVVNFTGGTAQMSDDLSAHLGQVIQDGVARVIAEEQLTTVTGGTDAGVFTLLGQGLEHWGRSAPCIGVAVAGIATWPGGPSEPDRVLLEPHHSHFVLVEGQQWGDETTTMFALMAALSKHAPSVAVFASGGAILRREVLANVRQRRPIIALAGSGRFADELAAVVRGERAPDADDLVEIVRDGNITLFDLRRPPEELADLVRQKLRNK
jgi:hypothetical protein